MFLFCRKGIVIDFISDYVDYKDKEIFYTNPERIFRYCKSLSRRITLRHDYMPYEFLVYLYKNDKKNKKNVFQETYLNLSTGLRTDEWLKK